MKLGTLIALLSVMVLNPFCCCYGQFLEAQDAPIASAHGCCGSDNADSNKATSDEENHHNPLECPHQGGEKVKQADIKSLVQALPVADYILIEIATIDFSTETLLSAQKGILQHSVDPPPRNRAQAVYGIYLI